jgi:hypothetical protein
MFRSWLRSFAHRLLGRPAVRPIRKSRAPRLELLEDRTVLSANYVGAFALGDTGTAITLDGSGNFYVAGSFSGTQDFDPGAGTFNLTASKCGSSFVAKYTANGSFLWARAFNPSSGSDHIASIAVDSAGNVYTTGEFCGTVDFDPGTGTVNLTSAGTGGNAFVSKLNASGNYVWAVSMAGSPSCGTSSGAGIAVDSAGNVYTTGQFSGTVDFNPGAGTANLSTGSTGGDAYVSKLDTSGHYVWAVSLGGSSRGDCTAGQGIAVDGSGSVFTVGNLHGTADFDPGAGVASLSSTGSTNAYISKLDTSGHYVWARALVGTNSTSSVHGAGIAVDSLDNVYTTGEFSGTVDFDPGAGTATLSTAGTCISGAWVSKLDSSGHYVWATVQGGASSHNTAASYGIALDSAGNVYTTGQFSGTVDFNPGAGTDNKTASGCSDIFISKLSTTGAYLWSIDFGSSRTSSDSGAAIAVARSGNIYTTGTFSGTVDFDPGTGTANRTATGCSDGFVSILTQDVTPPTTTAVLAGTPGNPGWYRSSVSVSLSATDNGGTGVAGTYYSLDGGKWQDYTGVIPITAQGPHTVSYYSVDMVGNVEAKHTASFSIDTIPPALSVTDFVRHLNQDNYIGAIYGTAEPGATITLNVLDNLGHALGWRTVIANAAGQWSFSNLDTSGLGDGYVVYHVFAADAAGNFSYIGSVTTLSHTLGLSVQMPPIFPAFTGVPIPVLVQVVDAFGNPIHRAGVPVTILSTTSDVSGTLTVVTNSNGLAYFNDLIFALVGPRNLVAISPGVAGGVSPVFDVQSPF